MLQGSNQFILNLLKGKTKSHSEVCPSMRANRAFRESQNNFDSVIFWK